MRSICLFSRDFWEIRPIRSKMQTANLAWDGKKNILILQAPCRVLILDLNTLRAACFACFNQSTSSKCYQHAGESHSWSSTVRALSSHPARKSFIFFGTNDLGCFVLFICLLKAVLVEGPYIKLFQIINTNNENISSQRKQLSFINSRTRKRNITMKSKSRTLEAS